MFPNTKHAGATKMRSCDDHLVMLTVFGNQNDNVYSDVNDSLWSVQSNSLKPNK